MGPGKQEIGRQLQQAQDLADARLREATLRMVRSLKTRPEPRWRWDNVAAARSTPWRPLVVMIESAIAAGAPVDDALAPVFEIEAQTRARTRGVSLLGEPGALFYALVDEARADATADVAQAEASAAPSRAALERVIDTTERHIRTAQQLAMTCRQLLTAPLRLTSRGRA